VSRRLSVGSTARTVTPVTRILRSTLPDGFFHYTANAVHETVFFKTDADRILLLYLLLPALRDNSVALYSYCLLDTHYHAIVSGRVEDLSNALHRAHSTYAREHNVIHERKGALFRERFRSWVIRDEDHWHRALEYVRMNPVEAGIVKDPSDWPWSFERPGI